MDWAKDEEVSVSVDDNLTHNSLMEDVMIDGEAYLELGYELNKSCKYLICKQSGGKLTLEWDRFKNLTVNNLLQIKHVHDDYIITKKHCCNWLIQ